MIKKIFIFFFFCIFPLSTQSKNSGLVEKFVTKFSNINNIQFDFIQTSNDVIEKGSCFLSYPEKLICRYQDEDQKEVVIKDSTLAIVKRKYKVVYYYRVANSPFATILNKNKIIEQIKNIKDIETQNKFFVINFGVDQENTNLQLFINKTTLNIDGWKTTGYDGQSISFDISNSQLNVDIVEKFEIPNYELERQSN